MNRLTALLAAPVRRVRRAKTRRTIARPPAPPHGFSFADAPATSSPSPFPFMADHDNLLEQLGDKYEPTKRTHNYLVYYWLHLRDIRLAVRSVLEIGVQTDKSIRMWEEFFPNAIIYGMDIDPACQRFEGDRRRILIGDQGDAEFLRHVNATVERPFDVIIDDGSHRVAHQLTSFDVLFPAMSEHGIYIVEDTGGCVGDYGLRTVSALSTLVREIMYWPKGFEPRDWPHLSTFAAETPWISRHIVGIAFYRWIVFVMRGKNPDDNPYLTPLEVDTAR